MPKIKGLSFTVIVPAILCSIYSTSVSADPRPYVAVDLGVTNASASRMIRDIGVTECDQGLIYLERCDASNSGRGWAGYLGVGMQLSPRVAVELGYFDIADDTDTVHITAESSRGTRMEGWQNINVKISAITLHGQYMALPAPAYLRRVDDRLISAGTIGLMYTF